MAHFDVYKGDEVQENDPLYKLLKDPNPFQGKRQFLWDYMFWNMLGTSYMFSTTKGRLNDSTRLYWLNNARIEFPTSLTQKADIRYRSKQRVNELDNEIIYYHQENNKRVEYKLSEIKAFTDLTNGINNWYASPSRIDALHKVISNSEQALDAKNINLDFAGKFLVGGQVSLDNVNELPLTKGEQRSIEDVVTSKKKVTAVKSMIDIKRFVENMGQLKLDESFTSDYFTIGSMYGIPKEVLDANLKGSTYENQEKAIGRHVGYSLQPKADDLANGLENYFGYNDTGLEICFSFDHLPFMQVFEKERAEVNKTKAETFKLMTETGITPESAMEFLEMEVEYKSITNGGGN